jgi:hypothetical protein
MRGTPHRIIVAGAGYAGTMAATSLARRTRRYASHRAVHGIPDILAGTGVEFANDRTTAIEPTTSTRPTACLGTLSSESSPIEWEPLQMLAGLVGNATGWTRSWSRT